MHELGGKLREMLKSCFGVAQLDYQIFAFNECPASRSPSRNDLRCGKAGGETPGHRIPTLRTFLADWARATTGHAAAAPPRSVMNSRRRDCRSGEAQGGAS